MTIEGTLTDKGDPYKIAIQARSDRRSQAEARWNNPETQRIEAERRQMDADKGREGQIDGLNREINRLRIELDNDGKVRLTKESNLRTLVERLAELTGSHVVAEVEPIAEEVIADRIEVDEASRGRGRPRKVGA